MGPTRSGRSRRSTEFHESRLMAALTTRSSSAGPREPAPLEALASASGASQKHQRVEGPVTQGRAKRTPRHQIDGRPTTANTSPWSRPNSIKLRGRRISNNESMFDPSSPSPRVEHPNLLATSVADRRHASPRFTHIMPRFARAMSVSFCAPPPVHQPDGVPIHTPATTHVAGMVTPAME